MEGDTMDKVKKILGKISKKTFKRDTGNTKDNLMKETSQRKT
jgi:hypothetical protein